MNEKITKIAENVLAGNLADRSQGEYLFSLDESFLWDILYWANQIRLKFFGRKIKVCSIVPARLGGCSQDCKFCAQSGKHNTSFKKTELMSDDKIIAAAKAAKEKGVPHFCIVYSGRAVSEEELVRLEKLIPVIKNEVGIDVCGGLGIVNYQQLMRLKKAGMSRYNHNVETSRNHFKNIVSTHSYESRVETVKAAKKAGLGLCVGGIFGIGETETDRLDMAFELRELDADMMPMNFLSPIPGTPMGDMPPMKPLEILRLIALYRIILPKVHIKAAGGRVLNLRDMQSWIFYAGTTSIISGDVYLTTAGRAVEADLQMIKDLGLEPDVTKS
ncbi:MAG: biotin synthase BioB [Phycisphaerae bacterium]